MRPISSTDGRARAAGVAASLLLPLALAVAACGGGGSGTGRGSANRADGGSAGTGSTGTVKADSGAASTVSAGSGSSGTISDATTQWCTAFRSVDQNPAKVDEVSMLSVAAPRDDLEVAWQTIVENHDKLRAPGLDADIADRYSQLKTFADTYCGK